MAQPQLLQIKLSRFDAQPWGFRLQGGVDFATPLVVQKVNGGSLAESAGLIPGDAVLKINDVDVYNLRHKEAQDVVVRSGNNFVLTVQRGGSTWRPHIAPTGNLPQPQQNSPYLQTVTKTSLAHKQQEGQHIGCGYNNAARPFANGGDGSVKSIVNKQYNTPVGIYSDESIAETLSAQAEVLAGGVLGVNFKKNEKEYQADKSEVLKFLREEETGHSTPAPHQDHQHHQQHHHQQQQQQLPPQQQQHYQPSATRHVSAPVNAPKPPSTGGLPTGQNICHECERLITGVFVRIKDKNLHVECFKCATCGTSLKNQGYYNFNNKLYCDIHAKLAAMQHPPSGTDGYVPVPIKPNTKLSANTISSALNAHGFSDIPYSNGGSAKPSPVPVNQGYARPFGAASGPPAAAPKSPVSYAPQRPAVNPYATLPRTNIGQQELCTKPTNANATLPHNVNSKSNRTVSDAHQIDTNLQAGGDATAMLTESIGRINMGDKMDNFMAEAGKIISNMLEARLASNGNTLKTSSHGGSTSSLRSNCSSNPSRSPMVIRKRFDLDDFKNVDPTEPVSLKPVLAVQQPPPVELSSTISQKAESPISIRDKNVTQPIDLPKSHPMGKVLDLCDNNKPVCTSTTKNFDVDLKTNDTGVSSIMPTPLGANSANSNCDDNCQLTTNQPQTVVYREKASGPRNSGSSQRNGEMSFHAMDRRSYIEPNDLNVSDSARDGPAFSINVRALGPKSEINEQPSNTVMTPENEQVVSQLLKDGKRPICCQCNTEITKGPFITALGRIWCPEHFICVNANCRRALQDIGFVEEKGDLYCEYCFEKYLAPTCSKCGGKIKGDCLNAIGKQFHPECFTCGHCGKLFGNTPFFLEDGNAYCEADWNELFTTKCFACGFPVEAGDRWVEALNHNYHSQCFNCTYCKQNLEGQSFYNKGGRPFCKNHAR
ncbi:PDZ and LIM domain protein Zasp isoform X4 [Anastrepha obliqua]|uniref:PDZ and LIM domain protein Zasp isoform X4 n=1 Tax=Anastrepha obliqua TaxID=95512 RepID=UPI00240970EA|nr:PDZ and LIM domain protein Zasp isoform X4 [Anastrepha obliqua]